MNQANSTPLWGTSIYNNGNMTSTPFTTQSTKKVTWNIPSDNTYRTSSQMFSPPVSSTVPIYDNVPNIPITSTTATLNRTINNLSPQIPNLAGGNWGNVSYEYNFKTNPAIFSINPIALQQQQISQFNQPQVNQSSPFWISLLSQLAMKFASHPGLSQDRREKILSYIGTLIAPEDITKDNYENLKENPSSNPAMLALIYTFIDTTPYDISIINYGFDHGLNPSDVILLLMINNESDLRAFCETMNLNFNDIRILSDLKRQSAYAKIMHNW